MNGPRINKDRRTKPQRDFWRYNVLLFDHIELYVTDREKAVIWYEKTLGLTRAGDFDDWAKRGPLMISNGQNQMIALFEGPAQNGHPSRGFRRLAFRVNGEQFIDFIKSSMESFPEPLGRNELRDHGIAISVYFPDPFGNQLEITTYDHEPARKFMDTLPPEHG